MSRPAQKDQPMPEVGRTGLPSQRASEFGRLLDPHRKLLYQPLRTCIALRHPNRLYRGDTAFALPPWSRTAGSATATQAQPAPHPHSRPPLSAAPYSPDRTGEHVQETLPPNDGRYGSGESYSRCLRKSLPTGNGCRSSLYPSTIPGGCGIFVAVLQSRHSGNTLQCS